MSDQTKFRLNEINKIKDYFNSEIQERKIMSKKLSKYIAAFDYIDKTLVVLSATSGGISTISFTSVTGIPARLASASFTLIFSLTTGIIKKLLKITRKKKNKYNKIVMLAKSKLNSIETSMSQALIDLDISHEEFKTIVNDPQKFIKRYMVRTNMQIFHDMSNLLTTFQMSHQVTILAYKILIKRHMYYQYTIRE